jgi:hypothetical protein
MMSHFDWQGRPDPEIKQKLADYQHDVEKKDPDKVSLPFVMLCIGIIVLLLLAPLLD